MPKEMNYSGKDISNEKKISDMNIKEIMFFLPEDITHLDLSYNLIGDKGVEIIFRSLIENKKIEELNLQYNKNITLAGCNTILNILNKYGTNLRVLNIAIGMADQSVEAMNYVSKKIEVKVINEKFKKSSIDDVNYNISPHFPTAVSKVNQPKYAPSKDHNKRNHIIQDTQISSSIIHPTYMEKDINKWIELSSLSETGTQIKTTKTQEDKYETSIHLPKIIHTPDLVDQKKLLSQCGLQLEAILPHPKHKNLTEKYESKEDKYSLKNEDFAEQWNGVTRKLQKLRHKLRSSKQSPATDAGTANSLVKTSSNHLTRTQIEQIELARELFNIKLTQVFTKALAISYQLVDAHNQSRIGTVVGGAITLISALAPLPGAGLVGQALVAVGKFVINKFITLSTQKVMEGRDIKRHGQRLARGDIDTIDKAAKVVKALVDGLTCRYQLILAQLDPESLEVFVNCVIKRMMNYWDKIVPDEFKKEGAMKKLGQGLANFTQSPYQFLYRKRPLTKEEQFKYFIENMIIGSSLWYGREVKNSGILAKESSGSGKIAKAAEFVVGDRLIKYLDSKGDLQTAMVQKICRDSPVVTGRGDLNESGLPIYHHGATKQYDFPPLYLSETECRLRRYKIGKPALINLHIQPQEFKEYDLVLMSLASDQEVEIQIRKFLQENKQMKDKPILIKQSDQFSIYGRSEEGEWRLTGGLDAKLLNELKFSSSTTEQAHSLEKEKLVIHLSLVEARRDDILRKIENQGMHSRLEKERDHLFSLISKLEDHLNQIRHDKKLPNKMPRLIPVTTKGGGDCAFHAILGTRDPLIHQFVCSDIKGKREQVRVAIVDKKNPEFQRLVTAGIQELVMSGCKTKRLTQELQKKYQEFLSDQKDSSNALWLSFQSVLKSEENDVIMKYIHSNHSLAPTSGLRDQFYDALNKNEGELYGLILSLPHLHDAFQEYNRLMNTEFDWNFAISAGVKQEYADFVGTAHAWLLPSELAVIAHVFRRTVDYYPSPGVHHPLRLNPGQSTVVCVQFNGTDHFERLQQSGQDIVILSGSQVPHTVYREITLKKGHTQFKVITQQVQYSRTTSGLGLFDQSQRYLSDEVQDENGPRRQTGYFIDDNDSF